MLWGCTCIFLFLFSHKISFSSTEFPHTVSKYSCILVLYYYVKNYYKLRGLKTTFISTQFCNSEVAGFAGFRRPKSRCQPCWDLIWGRFHFQVHSGWWQNSVPAAVDWGPCPWEPSGQSLSLSLHGSVHQQRSNHIWQVPLTLQISLASSSAASQRKIYF